MITLRSRKALRYFAALLLWLLALPLLALPSRAERLPIKTYTVADGLLRDDVNRIRQDSRGFLWFCTPEGLSRFDGYGFTNYRTDDGLPDRHVNDFLERADGTYLIATDIGIARLNVTGISGSAGNPLFTVFELPDAASRRVSVLMEDRNNVVWVGTSDGVFRLNERYEFERVHLELSHPGRIDVISLLGTRDGSVWAGVWGGIYRIAADGSTSFYGPSDGLPGGGFSSMFEDSDGAIWVGMRPVDGPSGGLMEISLDPAGSQLRIDRSFGITDGLPASWVTDIKQAADGTMWVGTVAGLCRWQPQGGSVCRTFTARNGVCDLGVTSILEDKDANIWLATPCGVKKLARYGFTSYTVDDGFKSPVANSIFEDRSGELFISVIKDGRFVSRFSNGKLDHIDRDLTGAKSSSGWGWKQTVLHDSSGIWWIPTTGGLFRSPPNTTFERLQTCPIRKVPDASDHETFRVFEDSRRDIWITTTAGELFRWDRGADKWNNVTAEAGFSNRLLGTGFAEDKSGNLWIVSGSDTGDAVIDRYRDGQFEVFNARTGVQPGWVRDLIVDHLGRLWLANTSMGLLRMEGYDGGQLRFADYTTAQGLSSNGAYCVTEDEYGRIYVGTGRGLDRLRPETGEIENFTTADGLPASYVELAYKDQLNRLWFGTSEGLARFQPEPERPRQPPTMLITGLRVAGSALPVSTQGERSVADRSFDSAQSNVSVDFVGLGATLGEKLKYEYRLSGSDWIPTTERTVNFANLSPGMYEFEVRAVAADRLYSEPATFNFSVASPLWQRWWFVVLLAVLFVGVVYLIYQSRLRRLLEIERMRTRISTDLHDDIGANLTRISVLSEVAKQKAENGNGSLLTSIAEIARESVASMNDIVWAVSPKHDSLTDLVRRMRRHAEEVFSFRDVELEFDAPETDPGLPLTVDVRRDLLLVFKEAVNNAAKHSACTRVVINLDVHRSELFMTISDNGRGFAVDDASADGQGLGSIRRRAGSIGAGLNIRSGTGRGTTITLRVPLSGA